MDSGGGRGGGRKGMDCKWSESVLGNGHNNNYQQYYYCYPSLFPHQALRITLLFMAMVISCLLLFHSSAAYRLRFLANPFYNPSTVYFPGNDEYHKLQRVLKSASTVDRTVIITTLNMAWAAPNSVFDLFLESFKIGNQTNWLLKHLVVIALDQKAYARCLKIHSHCLALNTEGVDFSGEAYFMTEDYLTMMWRRIDFLRVVLEMGYNFIFTDADIMWFRNPFPLFYSKADFQIACDYFRGKASDKRNQPNGGFNYVKSNKRTIEFYKFWYESRENYPGKHDQDVLNNIKYDPLIQKIGLKIRFLNTAYFGGFCQPSRDLNRVCTMHANCCVGLDNKIHDLKIVLDDWRKYLSLSTDTYHSSWTVPQRCGAASFRSRKLPPRKNLNQEKVIFDGNAKVLWISGNY